MESSPLTINCHDQTGRDASLLQQVTHKGSLGAGIVSDNGKMYPNQTMYVTLNSAAQHSPDTVWTLPTEQQESEVGPLDSGKEDGVSDVMEDPGSMMPFEAVEDSNQQQPAAAAVVVGEDGRHKDKEPVYTAGDGSSSSSSSLTDPWQLEVQGLPWQTRHPLLMRNLTESWKREKMCPHPHCPHRHNTPMTYPTANPLIYHHWYTTHMAPGYCKIFTCELCAKVLKTKPAMKSHLVASHKYGDSEAATLVRKMEAQWENLVDGKRDPAPGFPWKHCDSVSIQHLLTTWKANKFTCPHHACKSRLYRPWQAVLHWYQDHMAMGFSQNYTCPSCSKQFNLLEFFRHHLEIDHALMTEVNHGIVESTLTLWSKLIELKKPLTDVVIAANRKERMSNVKLPPQKMVEAPGMPWRMWCLETSRAVVAAWLIDEKVRCPHPGCSDKIKSEEEVMLHWQDQHMAPEFGTMYPCQHGVGSAFPCTKVFINKHDIIVHSKTEHGYSDWVIDAMLRNIEAASNAKLENGNDNLQSQQMNVMYAQVNGDSDKDVVKKTAMVSPQVNTMHLSPNDCSPIQEQQGVYTCQHGLGSQYPCTKSFVTEEDLVNHARTAHGYDDFVLNAMLRNIKVNRKEHHMVMVSTAAAVAAAAATSTTSMPLQNGTASSSPEMFAHNHVQHTQQPHHQQVHVQPKNTSETDIDASLAPQVLCNHLSLVTSAASPSDVAKQDLQAILWKAIVTAWINDKKCPHPKCIAIPDNYFPEYGQMLGHWMRNHIDYSLMERTFYPCLHGQNAQDLCMTVYSSAIDLKTHSVTVHNYRSEEIDLFISTLEAHIDNLTQEFCGPAVVQDIGQDNVDKSGQDSEGDKSQDNVGYNQADEGPPAKVMRMGEHVAGQHY